jgi:DNA-binding transcriptional MocR family regulator
MPGFFFWTMSPTSCVSCDATQERERAFEHGASGGRPAPREGIRIAPGWIFSNSSRYDNYLRINCGIRFSAEVDDAIKRLAAIVENQLI